MSVTLHTLTLLVRVIAYLPVVSIKGTCEALLRVLTMGDAVANDLCLQVRVAILLGRKMLVRVCALAGGDGDG